MYPTPVVSRTLVGDVDELRHDQEAIERVRAGEVAAFRALVDRYQRRVHGVIYRLVHHAEDTDDLAQQAFVAAFDALPTFDTARPFSSWIFRIAVNLAKDHLKSAKRGEVSLDGDPAPEQAAFAGQLARPDAAAARGERERLLERALQQLSVADREVLVLKDVEELSYEEMRAILRRPITALKIRVVRARARLRALVEGMVEEGALW
jgi:RNA polymerase sigma-70 factor (ECF subfamily)